MEPLIEDREIGIVEKVKEKVNKFKNSHKILFYVIVVFITVVIVAAIVVIYKLLNKKPKEDKKENYTSADDISSEFDYVNSYIYSTLGESEDENKESV